MRGTQSPVDQHFRIPLTVIAGDANAGKSSLVRHLLLQNMGRRLAAVVANESIVDASLVKRREGSRLVLDNGCSYIVADDDGAAALAKLANHRERPDHVVLDGNGATNPRRLTGFGYMPGYYLDGTILVTDAASVYRCGTDEEAEGRLREHATAAEVVLLNKLDQLGDQEGAEAQRIIERVAPAARIICCEHSRIAPPLLLGPAEDPNALDARAVVAQWTSDYVPVRSRGRPWPHGWQDGERYRSWCLVSDEPTDGRAFRAWVQQLPFAIMSGRGAVYLREEPQHRHTFHYLGSRWRLERGAPWGRDVPATRLLLAGLGSARGASWRQRDRADDEAIASGDVS